MDPSRNNESDEEELEAPLPLRSEEDWTHYNHQYRHCHSCSAPCQYPAPPHPVHRPPAHCLPGHSWHPSPYTNRLQNPQLFLESACADFTPMCSVSVNVPHFSLPPAGGVSQVNVGEFSSGSLMQERRRGAGLPEECKNIFITYSSDAALEVGPFAEFLTKQGFRPTVDRPDTSANCWREGFLKDPSILIIIAISPKYKTDVEGIAVDNHGRHTKYIHSMMENEFIQQGSLNFRFIPVLFLNASKEDVPRWLQDTIVYHWPRHSEDLLLRLLRRERYVPPPVATEIGVIIQPVPLCSPTSTL